MRKLGNDRLLLIIIFIYICGIISSFLIVSPDRITLKENSVSVWGIIQTFTLNYWYILLMWIFGLSVIGFIFNLFIVFFRGFIYGNFILHLVKVNFGYFLLISLIDLLLFLPMFILISYRSIMLSYSKQRIDRFGMENYNKLLLILTIVIFVYSILLEIIGGMYG